ncbi:MAG: metallophosphoesterase [Bacteroidales bacterium]|nr:metallophosphoesterase [Bacteroidales bacterium]
MNKRVITVLALAIAAFTANAQIISGPYLQNVSETGFTVVWDTKDTTLAWVEIAPDDGTHFYNTEREKIWETNLGRKKVGTHHVIEVSGLEPGSTWRYRALCSEVTAYDGNAKVIYGKTFGTDVYSKTPPAITLPSSKKPSTRFAVCNDIHAANDKLRGLMADAAGQNYDFVVFNGDLVSMMKSTEHIRESWLNSAAELFADRIPLYVARGNHETRGVASTRFMEYFPTSSGQPYYWFRYGPAFFLVLDGGEDKPDNDIEYCNLGLYDEYRTREAEWIADIVESAEWKAAPLHIVFCHIPPANGGWHADQDIYDKFVPILNNAGVDVMLCGHLHRHDYRPKGSCEGIGFPIVVNDMQTLMTVDADKSGKISIKIYDDRKAVSKEIEIRR